MVTKEQMTLYVKTLSGDLYTIVCSAYMAPGDFPFQVLPHLPAPRPPVCDLRLFPAYLMDEQEQKEQEEKLRNPFYFPLHFRDGDLFYLFIEPPSFEISIELEDIARLSFPHSNQVDDMEVYRLCVKTSNGVYLLDHLFYTLVYPVYVGSTHTRKIYTDVYYHEDDIIDNPSPVAHANGDFDERDVGLLNGATVFESPSIFANRCPIPSYVSYLHDKIHTCWMEHVCATGEPELYRYVDPEEEYERYGPLSDGE